MWDPVVLFSGVYWYLLLLEKETVPASLGLEPDPEKTKEVSVKEAGGSGLEVLRKRICQLQAFCLSYRGTC